MQPTSWDPERLELRKVNALIGYYRTNNQHNVDSLHSYGLHSSEETSATQTRGGRQERLK